MAKQLKKVEQSGTKSAERKLGSRSSKRDTTVTSGIVEFNIFVVTSDQPKLRGVWRRCF